MYKPGGKLRREECLLNRPLELVEALEQTSGRNADLYGPLRHCLRLALKREKVVVALVETLQLWWNPSAVIGGVVAVNINPVNCKTFDVKRLIVRDEGGDVLPSFAHRNSSATVISKPLNCGVVTSVHYAIPYAIKRMVIASVGCVESSVGFLCYASAGEGTTGC